MNAIDEQLLLDQAFKKFPKAKRIAVENFAMTADKMDTATAMNLHTDAASYKWNTQTVEAIKWVLRNKPSQG